MSYVDLMDTNRREKLYESYYFWCNCEKCKQIEPMIKAAACSNSLCASPCSIEIDECENCGAKLSENFKEEFREVINFITLLLKKNDISSLDVYKECLKKQEDILYRFNAHRLRILNLAFKAAQKCNYLQDAELYGKALEPGYLFYYGEMHPLTGLLYFVLGSIYGHLEKWNLAFEALEKANTILTITYGNEHSVMKEKLQPIFSAATAMKGGFNSHMMHKFKFLMDCFYKSVNSY